MNYSTQFKNRSEFLFNFEFKVFKKYGLRHQWAVVFPPKVLIINQDFKKLKTDKQAKRWNRKWRQRRLTL